MERGKATKAVPALEQSPAPDTGAPHHLKMPQSQHNSEPISELLQERGKTHSMIPDLPQGCQNGDPQEPPHPWGCKPQGGIPYTIK